MKNLSTIRTEVLRDLGDSTNQIWTAAEINDMIQEGYDKFCTATGILWRRYSLGDVANQANYDLPTECFQIERVEWNGYRIDPARGSELTGDYPSFETQTGDMVSYLMEGDGLRVLRRVPGAAATDSSILVIEYTRRGAALSADTVELELPDRYAIYVRFYALYQALRRDGEGRDLKLAAHFQTRYNVGVARCADRKVRARSMRKGIMGGDGQIGRPGGPPRPRLPWNFPDRRR